MNEFQRILADGFEIHQYVKEYHIPADQEVVWDILMQQKTFTDTQIWPFKVEFLAESSEYMEEGMENVHHGPLMLFSGEITRIDPPNYRALQYYLGSYFISMRLIRPTRLEFHLFPSEEGTRVRLTLSSQVKPWISGVWSALLGIFWNRFGRWISRYIRRNQKSPDKAKA